VQSFVSPAASRLLFGIAQKVTKKARRRRGAPPCIHESVHSLRPGGVGVRGWLLPLLLRQDAAQTGPPEARRGCVGSVRRRAHTMCARSLNVHGRTSSEPRSALAQSQGRMPGDRAVGGVFLWLPFFAQAKKVTRSP
jgi:hypothetical protein